MATILDDQINDLCVGCGDFASLCDSVDCAVTLQDHAADVHGACDILVCASADADAYNRGVIR